MKKERSLASKFPNGTMDKPKVPKSKAVHKAFTGRPNLPKRAKRKTAAQKKLSSKS